MLKIGNLATDDKFCLSCDIFTLVLRTKLRHGNVFLASSSYYNYFSPSHPLTFVFYLCLKYYGGHVASPSIPDDMEFINMAIQASRPDGKPPVPIWVTTKDDLVCNYIKTKEWHTL